MATVYEELHSIVEQLYDMEAQTWLAQMREYEENKRKDNSANWHNKMRALRERLKQKYGAFESAADVLNEVREERLDDLVGSE